MTPADVFTRRRFDWAGYLRRHHAHSGVNTADLHPIMGLRLAALFVRLVADGLADDRPGHGLFQISSAVRTRAEQIALYEDICLRQGRCSYVANPYLGGATDAEGVARYGSNHQAQRQSDRWPRALGNTAPVEVGYAVDIRNTGVAWAELHRRLPGTGLDWPMKGSPYEPWHLEAFPRSSPGGWLPGPFPLYPGYHRPLYVGLIGADVMRLQRQAGIADTDGTYGAGTARAVRRLQRRIGRPVTGAWVALDQRAFERAGGKVGRPLERPSRRPARR